MKHLKTNLTALLCTFVLSQSAMAGNAKTLLDCGELKLKFFESISSQPETKFWANGVDIFAAIFWIEDAHNRYAVTVLPNSEGASFVMKNYQGENPDYRGRDVTIDTGWGNGTMQVSGFSGSQCSSPKR